MFATPKEYLDELFSNYPGLASLLRLIHYFSWKRIRKKFQYYKNFICLPVWKIVAFQLPGLETISKVRTVIKKAIAMNLIFREKIKKSKWYHGMFYRINPNVSTLHEYFDYYGENRKVIANHTKLGSSLISKYHNLLSESDRKNDKPPIPKPILKEKTKVTEEEFGLVDEKTQEPLPECEDSLEKTKEDNEPSLTSSLAKKGKIVTKNHTLILKQEGSAPAIAKKTRSGKNRAVKQEIKIEKVVYHLTSLMDGISETGLSQVLASLPSLDKIRSLPAFLTAKIKEAIAVEQAKEVEYLRTQRMLEEKRSLEERGCGLKALKEAWQKKKLAGQR